MIIDFHIHGKITKAEPFHEGLFNCCIDMAKGANIDCIALTEHCHAHNFEETYQYLQDNYKYKKEYYLVNGIKVFVGIEVTTSIGLDIVFVGNRKNVFNLRSIIIDNIKDEFIDIETLFNIYNSDNMFVVLAHPYRNSNKSPRLTDSIIDKIDAIEYNATDLYKKGIESMKKKVDKLSQKINVPVIAGSDSHFGMQVGSVKTIFDEDTLSIKELKTQVKQRNFKIEICSKLAFRVENSIAIKKIITQTL